MTPKIKWLLKQRQQARRRNKLGTRGQTHTTEYPEKFKTYTPQLPHPEQENQNHPTRLHHNQTSDQNNSISRNTLQSCPSFLSSYYRLLSLYITSALSLFPSTFRFFFIVLSTLEKIISVSPFSIGPFSPSPLS